MLPTWRGSYVFGKFVQPWPLAYNFGLETYRSDDCKNLYTVVGVT